MWENTGPKSSQYQSRMAWFVQKVQFCLVFIVQEPSLQGGLNRAPGAPVVKTTPGKHLTPVQKLLHLAEVEGFRVQFTDYPKVRIKEKICFFHVIS